MTMIREPAVAGCFYPADPGQLGQTVERLIRAVPAVESPAPKALIVPHAGYVYSGPIAASAYARLRPYRDRYRRVVLLGPSHRVPVAGLALSSADAFRTPLGDVPVDKQAIARLDLPELQVSDRAHVAEHSLEVHLPFLQSVLGPFTLVPIVVGDATPEQVANVLEGLWDGPDTLIVVSSDLSHYLQYEEARRVDRHTCAAIEGLDARGIDHDGACGASPVSGLLLAARRHGMAVTTLDLRNSADTVGDPDAVVGYGAWAFEEH